MKDLQSIQEKIPKTIRKWMIHYLLDWISVGILVGTAIILDLAVEPFHHTILPGDVTISYGQEDSEVPNWLLLLASAAAPLLSLIVVAPWWRPKRLWVLHNGLLAALAAMACTVLLTNGLKLFVGQPRPDFFARVATDNDATIKEGRLAFPSGHASLSMAAMAISMYLLIGRFKALHPRAGALWKLLLGASPLVASFLIGGSRYRDHHHHLVDITCGWVLGFVCATFAYHLYFHPVVSSKSGRCRKDLLADLPDEELENPFDVLV